MLVVAVLVLVVVVVLGLVVLVLVKAKWVCPPRSQSCDWCVVACHCLSHTGAMMGCGVGLLLASEGAPFRTELLLTTYGEHC